MPLSADVALVSATEVAAITHEAGLSNLDDSTSGATLANALIQATNLLIVLLKARGVQPEKVSNTADLKPAAAFLTAFIVLDSQPDEDSQKRAEKYKARYEEQVKLYQFESIDTGNNSNMPPKGLPRAIHLNPAPIFARSRDDREPGSDMPFGGYVQK